jgi:CRISPR-associated protein Cmr6
MTDAAVPQYLGTDFSQCPPGHRFTLYGAFWERGNGWCRVKNIEPDKHLKRAFREMPPEVVKLRAALAGRQQETARSLSICVHSVVARSIAPFVAGTGIEHPLENGMAFLNPYGLPYLPGASVKGALRRAAQELAGEIEGVSWEKETRWSRQAIDDLFGKEPPPGSEETSRGALSFWDVLPACDGLHVEIMNPHYGGYYQGKSSPHDAGSPVPIYFLTLPPDSRFDFYVQCQPHRLKEGFDWRALLDEAFAHAFDWLGFGAKTAVGYGAMARDVAAEQAEREAQERRADAERRHREKAAARAVMSPIDRSIDEFLEQRPDKGQSEISAVMGAVKQGRWEGEEKIAVAGWLARGMKAQNQWRETSQKRNPNRDKPYQNTLLVKGWLQGK